MRLALISDTHGMLPEDIPDCDAIIHAGDIGPDRNTHQWWDETFRPWAVKAGVPIYATFGNHDFAWPPLSLTPGNLQLVVDAPVDILGLKVYFTPWVQNLPRWAWNLPDSGAAQKCYAAIPDDIDILVSHAPPSGYGDCLKESALKYGLERNTRVGSPELAARLESFEDIFVICGHIHEDRGRFIAQHNIVYNVSSVDGDYIPYPNRWTMLEF